MNRVAIDELRLRIPGVDEAAARAVAAQMAEELAARAADPGLGAGEVGELRLTVPWKPGTATDEVVRQVVRELLRALRQRA
jgi:hypothetical protein